MAEQSRYFLRSNRKRSDDGEEEKGAVNDPPLPGDDMAEQSQCPKPKRSNHDEKEKGAINDPPLPGDDLSSRIQDLDRTIQSLKKEREIIGSILETHKRRQADYEAQLVQVRKEKEAILKARAALAELEFDISAPDLYRKVTKLE